MSAARSIASRLRIAVVMALLGAAGAGAHGPGTTAAPPAAAQPAPPGGGGLNQPSAAIEGVELVRLVIMSHLDVGYTDYAVEVINLYFQEYFPAAIAYAAGVAQSPDPAVREMGYVFTSHPWLISLYLDCPDDLILNLVCPTAEEKEDFVQAIKQGVIGWQGYTFNIQAGLVDPSLFRFALEMTRRLDRAFGRETITVSLRDVPGTTRAILPLLREAGFRAFSVGANGAVVSAAVPGAFVWRDGPGGAEALALVHPGGYGGIKLQDCIAVPKLKEALCVWFTGDNAGPPDPSAVAQVHRILVKQYPRAKVKASGFDNFVRALETVRGELTVVDMEIGDTWLAGPPADPWKLAAFREMSRARAECFAAGRCAAGDPAIDNFSRLLLKAPEHTAGLSSTPEMQPYEKDWSNVRFEQVRGGKEFRIVEGSWTEQRQFLDWALAALVRPGASPAAVALHQEIVKRLAALAPSVPPTDGFEQVPPAGPFACGRLELGFDAATGAIDRLVDLRSGRRWAGSLVEPALETAAFVHRRRVNLEQDLRNKNEELDVPLPARQTPFADGHPLALFLYRTYDALDYYFYIRQYFFEWPSTIDSLSLAAFDKPGVWRARPQSRWWLPALQQTWRRQDGGGGCDFLLELALPAQAHARYGAPASAWVRVRVPPESTRVEIDLQWFDKTATRLPESLWMVFRPIAPDAAGGWRLQVLDSLLPPREVVVNGSRHLAAVWEGVSYCDPQGHLFVETLDATVLTPGLPALLDYNNQPVAPGEGMFFNLANNVWNTNWPLWYPWRDGDEDSRFRFTLHVEPGCRDGRRPAARP